MLVRVDDESAVLHGFDAIGARPGPVSILVNNAAIRPEEPPCLDDPGHAAGSPEAVARAVLALADPGEPYVTGQTLPVSGGRFMP